MDEDDIPDTRVFVSGLPPHYTSEQLGAHFAGRYQITDSVVIPGRRIGFVGFRNYTLAKNAVKYFDKSYIRMSKISVEIAKPVDFHREVNAEPESHSKNDPAAQPHQTSLRTTASSKPNSAFTPYDSVITMTSNKRKRADMQEQSKEMMEYMRVMQPKTKSTWANGEPEPKDETLSTKHSEESVAQTEAAEVKKKKQKSNKGGDTDVQAAAAADVSDAERKRRKKDKKEKKRQLEVAVPPADNEPTAETKEARKRRKAEKKLLKLKTESNAEGGVEPLNDDASGVEVAETDIAQPDNPKSDNDWLRGKTSRLLDLVDPDDHLVTQSDEVPNQTLEPAESSEEDEDVGLDEQSDLAVGVLTSPTSHSSSAKAIAVPNGRLFVRNLPFSTTESDLQSTFAKYGSITEVSN
jgi:multiple RNA-binding domain-containing protein 1